MKVFNRLKLHLNFSQICIKILKGESVEIKVIPARGLKLFLSRFRHEP